MKSSQSIEAQIARLMWVFNASTQNELAEALGIRQATVSEGIKKGIIPARWLLRAIEKAGIRPQWIRTGEGPMNYNEDTDAPRRNEKFSDPQNIAAFLRELPTAALVDEIRRRRVELP